MLCVSSSTGWTQETQPTECELIREDRDLCDQEVAILQAALDDAERQLTAERAASSGTVTQQESRRRITMAAMGGVIVGIIIGVMAR